MDEEEQLQRLGRKIREARERLGLSQQELAERISRSQNSISEYENGHRQLFAHNLPLIANALEVPISYFFSEANESDLLIEAALEELKQLPSDGAKQSALKILRELRKIAENMTSD